MAPASPRAHRIAPGLLRKPVATMPPVSGSPGGLPLTLTNQDPPESWPVGLLAPTGRPPWGCLFFSLLGAVIVVWFFTQRMAILVGLLGLIAYWASFNHPRRSSAEAVHRTLRLVGAGSGKRAWQALAPALTHTPDDDGLHYLAAMVSLLTGRSTRTLEHLDQARPRMQAYAEYHHLRGRCLRELDRPGEAAAAYGEALDYPAYPSRQLLLREAAELLEQIGDRDGLQALRARMAADQALDSPVQAQAFRNSLGRFAGEDESGADA